MERGLFKHTDHPYLSERRARGPIKVADQHDRSNPLARFNSWLAIKTTNAVGTMWCAYLFGALAVTGIPAALGPNGVGIVNWFVEEFIQLVLLSVIMVGQLIAAVASDKRAQATFMDTEALLHAQDQIAQHLTAQDAVLKQLLDPAAGVAE